MSAAPQATRGYISWNFLKRDEDKWLSLQIQSPFLIPKILFWFTCFNEIGRNRKSILKRWILLIMSHESNSKRWNRRKPWVLHNNITIYVTWIEMDLSVQVNRSNPTHFLKVEAAISKRFFFFFCLFFEQQKRVVLSLRGLETCVVKFLSS